MQALHNSPLKRPISAGPSRSAAPAVVAARAIHGGADLANMSAKKLSAKEQRRKVGCRPPPTHGARMRFDVGARQPPRRPARALPNIPSLPLACARR